MSVVIISSIWVLAIGADAGEWREGAVPTDQLEGEICGREEAQTDICRALYVFH